MLSNKACIVTGGGRGLGRATAIQLADLGANVVVNDLGTSLQGEKGEENPAEQTVREIRDNGGTAINHYGDITSMEYTESLVADTVDEYGRLDGVVNFAGILQDSISYKMTGDEWDSVINVHLRGHFSLLRNAAAHWREQFDESEFDQQRSFLGVSSISAFGSVGQLNYAAAKAGVLGMIRSAARELHRYNIRVNALMPSAYTRMIEDMPDEQKPFEEDEMPPEKIAPVVGYLMSDDAKDITGCTIRAAGDQIGLVSDPEITRTAIQKGGWTAQDIATNFRETVGQGIDLQKTETFF